MTTHTLSRILTLKFSGPIPAPMPAVTDPTPGDDYERHLAEQQAKSQATQQLADQQNREIKEATSMMGKLTSMGKAAMTQVNEGASKAHTSMEGAARKQLDSRSIQQFHESFPHLAEQKLICCYSCKVMHSGQKKDGNLFVTPSLVCFSSKEGIKDEIPLTELASIQVSVALLTSKEMTGKEDGPPYIIPIPHPSVRGDCLQLFTTGGQIFQFLNFDNMLLSASQHVTSTVHGTAMERAYNWLDHTWRAATTVPLPSVQYC
eukprot:TRINITY_DN2363_c1_g2_i1.p1 TRINITY_DN2363_c1_g2~~TRINITY_DN2363_c1_g2_i1.p1  ORF type:complete len:261 (+),score=43.04 TRINITY_DN2363_c1_g2_i1:93-875(+)